MGNYPIDPPNAIASYFIRWLAHSDTSQKFNIAKYIL